MRAGPENADDPSVLEGDLDSLARRVKVRQRVHQAPHGTLVRPLHFFDVIQPKKFGEVIIDGRLTEMTAGGAVAPLGQGLASERLMFLGQRRPCAQPLGPLGDRTSHAVVVARVHAVLEEAGAPIPDRLFQPLVSHTRPWPIMPVLGQHTGSWSS